MKVLADGRWKAVDCGEVVGGNRREADLAIKDHIGYTP